MTTIAIKTPSMDDIRNLRSSNSVVDEVLGMMESGRINSYQHALAEMVVELSARNAALEGTIANTSRVMAEFDSLISTATGARA